MVDPIKRDKLGEDVLKRDHPPQKKHRGAKFGAEHYGGRARKIEGLEAAVLSGLTPLEFFLMTMRDPEEKFSTRFKAAKEAAPYVHSRMAAITINDVTDRRSIGEIDARLVELIGELLRERERNRIGDGVGKIAGPSSNGGAIIDAEIIDHDEGSSQ